MLCGAVRLVSTFVRGQFHFGVHHIFNNPKECTFADTFAMVVGAFPLFKLASLAVKQISKPIANSLKTTAKQSDFFRKYVCIWPGQGYHWLETKVKMKLMGLAGPEKVPLLSEQKAVDVGAELLGESLVFGVAAALLFLEYRRGQKKEEAKEQKQNEKLFELHSQVKELELLVETNAAQVRELTRLVHSKDSLLK